MPKIVLTDRKIASLKPAPAGKRTIVLDAIVPGLGVRITDKGHRTFVLGSRFPGSRHFVRREIAQVGTITLAKARDIAREWHELLLRGIDPAAEKDHAAQFNFEAVAEAYIKDRLPSQRRGKVAERRIRNELVPALGHRLIHEITRPDVWELIKTIVDRPAASYARNCLHDVKSIFAWVVDRPRIYRLTSSPCWDITAKRVTGKDTPRRERVLTEAEIIALWSAAIQLGFPFGHLTRLLLLTGVRLNQAAGARWPEFDADKWIIPASRRDVKTDHIVPLTADMQALLAELPRLGECLFSVDGGRSPIRNVHGPKKRLDEIMGISGQRTWVHHDIRRTVRSQLSALRVPDHIAELAIGHTRTGIQKVYDRHRYEKEIRETLTLWCARLRSIVGENIITLPQKRQ